MGELRPITSDDLAAILRTETMWGRLGQAPIAQPRECRGCIHPRLSHSTWGCEWCSCEVSIVDLTPVARCAVCRRVLPARDIVGGECGDCYTVADRLYERMVDR